MTTLVLVIDTVLICTLALLVIGLLRSHAEILERLDIREEDVLPEHERLAADVPRPRPSAGDTTAYDIAGLTLDGGARKVGIRAYAGDTLIAFLSSGCVVCGDFWKSLADGAASRLPGHARLVAVTKDPSEESPSRLRELATAHQDVVMSSAAWKSYNVPVAPYFVYVDGVTGKVVGEGAARTWDQLVSMITDALGDRKPTERASWWRQRRRGATRAQSPADRDARADSALAAAGVGSDDPSLYPVSE